MNRELKNIYKCRVCGEYTESPTHCNTPCKLLIDASTRLRLSKLLSALLRHIPESIGLKLDNEGFVEISELVRAIKERWPRRHLYSWLTEEHVIAVAKLCPKQRFEIRGNEIRARYGHSVQVSIKLNEDNSVKILYHGTTIDALSGILKEGIKPMKRLKVHLTSSLEEAYLNASRRKKPPVILVIDAEKLRQKGHRIFRATNTIYLTDYVPPSCIVKVIKSSTLESLDSRELKRKP